MQFGEFKLNLSTLIGFSEIYTSSIDLKILSHKLEERAQIYQEVLLNLEIQCKDIEI